jgi:hypothetical protein
MASDHWRTRVKGGILRREFLRYAGRAIGWGVTVGAGALAGDFLAARRERPMTQIVSGRGTASGRAIVAGVGESITGTLNVQLEPVRLSATGTVSNPSPTT